MLNFSVLIQLLQQIWPEISNKIRNMTQGSIIYLNIWGQVIMKKINGIKSFEHILKGDIFKQDLYFMF